MADMLLLWVISDTKSEVAFKCLVVMLPAPPKRGRRVPKPLPTTCIGYFFNDCEVYIFYFLMFGVVMCCCCMDCSFW